MSTRRTTILALLSCLVVCFALPAVAENITYNIVSYPEYQHGWTLTGQITTDGSLEAPTILNWWWQSTNGSQTLGTTGTNVNPYHCYLTATANELQVFRTKLGAIELEFMGTDPGSGDSATFGYSGTNYYVFEKKNGNYVTGWNTSGGDFPALGADGFVIASVPEPSTIALLATGAASLLFMAWRRRKQSQ